MEVVNHKSSKISHNEYCRDKMFINYHMDIETSRIITSMKYYKRKFRNNAEFQKICENYDIDDKEKLKQMKVFNYLNKLNNL